MADDVLRFDPARPRLYFRVSGLPTNSWLAVYAVLPPSPGEPEAAFMGLLELENDVVTSKAVSIPTTLDNASFVAVSLRFVLETPPNTPAAPPTKIGIVRDEDPVSANGQRPVATSLDLAPDPSMRAEVFVAIGVNGGDA